MAIALLAILLTAPVAAASSAERSAAGILLFPSASPAGDEEQAAARGGRPAGRYVLGAAAGTVTVFPFFTASCLAGDLAGFLTGSVIRVPVWIATGGNERVGQALERAGNAMVDAACERPLFIRPEDIEAWRPPPE